MEKVWNHGLGSRANKEMNETIIDSKGPFQTGSLKISSLDWSIS